MKKLLLAIALVSVSFSYAQEVSYGVKAGLNVASLTGDLDDMKPRLGLHAGVFAEIRLSEKFSLQPELLFSQQGAKESYFEQGNFDDFSFIEKYDATYKFNYLNIPILAKVYLTDKFSIEAGPQISILTSAHYKYSFVDEVYFDGELVDSYSGSSSGNVKDGVKDLDFGLNLGFSYAINANFSVQTRYSLGLRNIIKDSDFDDMSVKNGVFQFSIGYKF